MNINISKIFDNLSSEINFRNKKQMPTSSINKYLTDYLIRINAQQFAQEALRQTIARNSFFQSLSVFERFDKFRKGDLVPSDFSEFMLQNELYPTQSELYLIFRDFDRQKIGVVTLQEFQAQLLPRQDAKLKSQVLNRKPYPSQARLTIDLEFLLKKYFQSKISAQRQLEMIRIGMKQVNPYFSEQSFLLVDYNRIGFLSKIQEIDRFLRRNGHGLQTQDLVRIYRALNFKNGDEITFTTFQSHLNPFSNGFYESYRLRMIQKQRFRQMLQQKTKQLNKQIIMRTKNQIQLSGSIAHLLQSNKKLESVIKQQDLALSFSQRRLQQNQAMLKGKYVTRFI